MSGTLPFLSLFLILFLILDKLRTLPFLSLLSELCQLKDSADVHMPKSLGGAPFYVNPLPAEVFGGTRPSGGGGQILPHCLTRAPVHTGPDWFQNRPS